MLFFSPARLVLLTPPVRRAKSSATPRVSAAILAPVSSVRNVADATVVTAVRVGVTIAEAVPAAIASNAAVLAARVTIAIIAGTLAHRAVHNSSAKC
jgi:formylmethanofuran dehydrogenase subunit B